MTRACIALLLLLVGLPAMTSAQSLDRTKRPPVGNPVSPPSPQIVRWNLSNGLPVWMVRRPQLPLVSVALQVRAGGALDGSYPGIAAMTAALLDDGTARYSATQFAEAVDFLGASLGASSGDEQALVSMMTLSKHLDSSLALMAEMVIRPTFPAEEIERERKSRLQALKQQRDQATIVASLNFNRVVYGEQHPYGRPASGTLASVDSIQRDDLVRHYQRYYRPNNAELIVVGDVDEKTLRPTLERALGAWKAEPVPAEAGAVPQRPAARPTAVVLIDKPGAAQSEIRIGHAGAPRTTTPDYYALQVMNTLLGGQFTSRVNLNLRERHGFTYGARSSWSFRRGDGPFFAAAGVFTAKTDSALTEFLAELRDIGGPRPATAAEVEAARNALIRSFPRRLETNDGVATVLAELAFFKLPESEIADFNARVAKVTPQQVTDVASRYIDPGHLAVVVVGDLEKIRPGIEALKLGPLRVLDAEGREVPQ